MMMDLKGWLNYEPEVIHEYNLEDCNRRSTITRYLYNIETVFEL